MQKKNLSIFTFILLTHCSLYISAATWKVFCYMDSSDSLSDMAIKNITDMVRGQLHDSVDFLVQLHAYDTSALRYRITNKGLTFLQEATLRGENKQDFIDAASWAFSGTDADYTMLIMWDHGWGILDPHWNEQNNTWQADADELSNECMIKRSDPTLHKLHQSHKGFIFTTNPRSYLTNQDLIDSLSFIKNNILHDKNLDILAFDTCMGSMFEVAYQVAPYAQYLVGSQSCSLRDGFEYQGIIDALNQGGTPAQIAEKMVQSFDAYYKDHDASGIYTHAALDLRYVYKVQQALDDVVTQLLGDARFAPFIMHAHDITPRFCLWPMYTDLVAFFKIIEEQLKTSRLSSEVVQTFDTLYAAVSQCVIARCGGHATHNKAYGCAVYLPAAIIDESYYTTVFAHESQWINLLKYMCQNIKDSDGTSSI